MNLVSRPDEQHPVLRMLYVVYSDIGLDTSSNDFTSTSYTCHDAAEATLQIAAFLFL